LIHANFAPSLEIAREDKPAEAAKSKILNGAAAKIFETVFRVLSPLYMKGE
jgi:hypothetical protein